MLRYIVLLFLFVSFNSLAEKSCKDLMASEFSLKTTHISRITSFHRKIENLPQDKKDLFFEKLSEFKTNHIKLSYFSESFSSLKKLRELSNENIDLLSELLDILDVKYKKRVSKKEGSSIRFLPGKNNRIERLALKLSRANGGTKVVYYPYFSIIDGHTAAYAGDSNIIYLSFPFILDVKSNFKIINFLKASPSEWHEFGHGRFAYSRMKGKNDFWDIGVRINDSNYYKNLSQAYADLFLVEEIAVYINGLDYLRKIMELYRLSNMESYREEFKDTFVAIESDLENVLVPMISSSFGMIERLKKITREDFVKSTKISGEENSIVVTLEDGKKINIATTDNSWPSIEKIDFEIEFQTGIEDVVFTARDEDFLNFFADALDQEDADEFIEEVLSFVRGKVSQLEETLISFEAPLKELSQMISSYNPKEKIGKKERRARLKAMEEKIRELQERNSFIRSVLKGNNK